MHFVLLEMTPSSSSPSGSRGFGRRDATWLRRAGLGLGLLFVSMQCSPGPAPTTALEPWPLEPEELAANLTRADSGLRKDLSGAVWNPHTNTLWVCRNGPGKDSRLWVLECAEDGDMQVSMRGEQAGEWRGLGDCEGVTFASFEEEVVYLLVEGEEQIHELDVSTYGEPELLRVYDTSPFLPRRGSDGAEGITFLPDAQLSSQGFVDARGEPRVSRKGMGGVMMVGHQNGGGLFAFELDRDTSEVEFLGEYRVPIASLDLGEDESPKLVALELDRASGRLWLWFQNAGMSRLVEVGLSSTAVPGESFRALRPGRTFTGPSDRAFEGLAIEPAGSAERLWTSLFLTVDDGGDESLLRFGR